MQEKNNKREPLICLMGPTASGKTDLAIRIGETLPCEIVSVDSAMVYRGMDIGTAKPDQAILKKVPHHLIDFLDPTEHYSVGQFCEDVLCAIEGILSRHKVPLLVGGTMMYFRALQQGLACLPKRDEALRAVLTARAEKEGWEALHHDLSIVDPEASKKIHKHDSQRIQRALEVFTLTGRTISTLQTRNQPALAKYDVINFAIAPIDRITHHEKIKIRFQAMLDKGLIEEVRCLTARGDLTREMPSMRAVGYRQVWDYLANDLTYDEMCSEAIIATRQLAKHQRTWLRTFRDLTWYESEDERVCFNLGERLRKVLLQCGS